MKINIGVVYEYEQRKKEGQVSEIVNLDDMDYDEENDQFSWNCRCGHRYIISFSDFEKGCDTVQCTGCSLFIQIKTDDS